MQTMRGLVWCCSALALAFVSATTTPATPTGRNVRAILARHDPDGRLPHTSVKLLGKVRTRTASYAVYYLEFVNPLSHRGQQRIAIIANGSRFGGAYQCTLGTGGASIRFARDRFTVSDHFSSWVVRFNGRGPTRYRYFCGEGSGWENAI